MIQVIIILLILLLGFLVFHFYPIQSDIKSITLSAMFIVVTLVCKRFFTVLIPLFGVESLKIGIEYIPLMLAGYLLAPGYAFLIGLACDLIGLIIVPTGFPFFGFTLTMICVALVPSIIAHTFVRLKTPVIIWLTRLIIIILGGASIIYISTISSFTVSDTVVKLSLTNKIVLDVIMLIVIGFVYGMIYFIYKRVDENELKLFSLWCLSVLLVEMLCTLFLTPLWLQIMYSIPMLTSVCIRVIKEVFILPIEIFIGFIILKALKHVMNHN